MIESSVGKSIRGSARNQTIIGALLLIAALGLTVFLFKSLLSVVLGPAKVTPAELTAYAKPGDAPRSWVRVDGVGLYDSGYRVFRSEDNGPEFVAATFSLLDLDGTRMILVERDGDITKNINQEVTVTGALTAFSEDERTNVYQDLIDSSPLDEETLLPFKMTTENVRAQNWWWIPIILVLAVLGIINLLRGIARGGDYTQHPIYKSLARYSVNVDSTIAQIEGELLQPHTEFNQTFHLTRSWLVNNPGSTFEAMKFADLAWVYRHVQTTRSYGIPVSKTHSLIIFDRYKTRMQPMFGNNEDLALNALQSVFEQAPWAIYGFDNDTQKRWNKENEPFIAEVDQRRRQAEQSTLFEQLDTAVQQEIEKAEDGSVDTY